jgi:hypothetical protein
MRAITRTGYRRSCLQAGVAEEGGRVIDRSEILRWVPAELLIRGKRHRCNCECEACVCAICAHPFVGLPVVVFREDGAWANLHKECLKRIGWQE